MPLGLGLGITKLKSLVSGLRVRFQGNATITAALDGILRDLSADFVSNGTVTAALEAIKLLDVDFSGEGTLTADLVTAYSPADDPDIFDWWDAQSGVSTSGGELTAWVGAVNSETANPPTVTSRPQYGSDQINGLNVLTFRSADPNYLQFDFTSLGSGCCVHLVINQTSTNSAHFASPSLNGTRLQSQSGDSNAYSVGGGFGSSIDAYNKTTFIANNPTRGQVYTISSSTTILVLDNIDFTSLSLTNFGVRNDLGIPFAGQIADIIISTSNTNITENTNYLIDKYGL